MRVADDELDAVQLARAQRVQKLDPERLGFGVADREAEHSRRPE
jgi:hypothetical protein